VSTRGESIFIEQIEASQACLEASKALAPAIDGAADAMVATLNRGGRILACGNGGSAADASHFTTELLCRLKDDRPPLPAISLTADSSFLSATANDYGYDDVFARQVQGLGTPGDLLVAISTSGQSPNIVKALEAATQKKLHSISLLGRDGGACRGLAEIDLIVPHTSTARIQEAHQVIIHTLCLLVEHQLFDMPPHL
jgi:D-sedoheptulose 7-phosphate isomerase